MQNKCHICNSDTYFLMDKNNYPLYKCPKCDLVYMNPLPKQDFLKKDVYSFESGYQANKPKDLSKTQPNNKTKDILNYINKENIKGNLLDIGCSNGEFIYHAQKIGLKGYGVELNARTAQIAKDNGLNVFNGLLNDAYFDDNFFDIIFLGDLIEHVLSPRELLKECKRILKRNGLIIIATPNLDSIWSKSTFLFYKLFKIPWSSVTPPHHTYQFSIKNLDILLQNYGLIKIYEKYYKPPRLMYELGSLHLYGKYKKNKTIFNLLFMVFSFILYSILYLFTIISGYFIKKNFSMINFYKNNE